LLVFLPVHLFLNFETPPVKILQSTCIEEYYLAY
jgi:hypothetical protein